MYTLCVYIYIYIHTYTYTYIYIYTHTYTYTHRLHVRGGPLDPRPPRGGRHAGEVAHLEPPLLCSGLQSYMSKGI